MEAAVEAGIHSIHADLTQGAARARGGLPVKWLGDGDYFGRTVNLAARIAGHAGAGQVLVTDEVVAAAESDRVRYETLGPVRLKGFPQPVRLHLALPASQRQARQAAPHHS